MPLPVFIRLNTQTWKASLIHHALNKLVLGIKVEKRKLNLEEQPTYFWRKDCSEKKKNVDKIPRKVARIKDPGAFDPRIESHRQINSGGVSNFFHRVQIINKNAVLFKSIETCDTTVCSDFSSLIIQNEKEKVLSQNIKTEQEKTQAFPKNMSMSGITIEQVEKNTRGQNLEWVVASNLHWQINCFK